MTQWVKKALDVKVSGPELDPQNPYKRSDTSNDETAGRNYWLSGVHWPPSQTYLAMFQVDERYYGNQKVEGRHPKNNAQGCSLASTCTYVTLPHTNMHTHEHTFSP